MALPDITKANAFNSAHDLESVLTATSRRYASAGAADRPGLGELLGLLEKLGRFLLRGLRMAPARWSGGCRQSNQKLKTDLRFGLSGERHSSTAATQIK